MLNGREAWIAGTTCRNKCWDSESLKGNQVQNQVLLVELSMHAVHHKTDLASRYIQLRSL